MVISIAVDTTKRLAPVAPEIYGGLIEHLGRNVYGGVYDPADPTADTDGFRQDVLEAVRELDMPVSRYPGGCFTDTWHWEEGIGDRAKRPARLDFAWRQHEPNTFGIDEFMKWAKKAGTEPMITLNLSTRGVMEALDLFEYCNVPGGTRYSDLRRQNGHEKPYNVRYWCLGNEIYGDWEIGHKSAEEYGRLACETAKMFKRYDPDLKMILCGNIFSPEWNRTVLEMAYEHVDYLSLHEGFNIKVYEPEEFLCRMDLFASRIENAISLCRGVKQLKNASHDVLISIDEWIVWDSDRRDSPETRWTVGRPLLEQDFTLLDAAVAGELLSLFHNHADTIRIACVAQTINVIAPIRTAPGGRLWKQTTYPVFAETSRYGRGEALKLDLSKEVLKELYMSAVWNEAESSLVLFVTSRRVGRKVEFEFPLSGIEIIGPPEGVTLSCENYYAVNTEEDSPVKLHKFKHLALNGNTLSGILEPASWNRIRIPCRLKQN